MRERITFTDEDRINIWKYWYGDNPQVTDPYGRNITWNHPDVEIDHIWPFDRNGSDNRIENLIFIHRKSNTEKGDNTSGVVNNKYFEVRQAQKDNDGFIIGKLIIK